MKVNREKLLQQLESVQSGLSAKEIVEQSSCFVFTGGKVFTFNDEISCYANSPLKIEGAVSAAPLVAILQKVHVDELEIEVGKGELLLKWKNREVGVTMEKDILLPISVVEKPGAWNKLPDDFTEAIEMTHQCAGKDQSHYAITCVHIHPKWIEACDNFQMTRYKVKTGIAKPTLVRGTSIQHIVPLGMTEMSESETWLHFRNPSGLVFSCRRDLQAYEDLSGFLDFKGDPLTLPKGLGEDTNNAEIFSSEDPATNHVLVELRPGKLRVEGRGNSGWYRAKKTLKYSGAPFDFRIAPKLLIQLTERHNECEITKERLKVDGGKYTYVTCLTVANGKDTANGAGTETDESGGDD